MRYARFGDESDVYVFRSVHGTLECAGCNLAKDDSRGYATTSASDMVRHLRRHEESGNLVPESAIAALLEEARQT